MTLWFLFLLAATGCSEGPKAPPLIREAVYQNDAIGLRFLTPDEWVIKSKANLPPGPLPKPVMLASYMRRGEEPAELNLVAAEVPEGTDVGRFVAEYRLGPEAWTLSKGTEPVAVTGAEGTRYTLTHGDSRREATAFRRGGRVYIFFVTYKAGDVASRAAGRKCVESATWATQ